MRRFWLQSGVSLGQFARRFAASSDVYNQRGRAPYATVNMLTAHDGFTLQDVVSFNEKHNQPNGEGNRDGSDRNFSNNHGVEGLVADDAIVQRRRASQRAMLATLLLSQERRCCWPAMNRTQPAGEQQRLLPGQRHHLARLVHGG